MCVYVCYVEFIHVIGTSRCFATFEGHDADVNSISCSSDGTSFNHNSPNNSRRDRVCENESLCMCVCVYLRCTYIHVYPHG